MAVALKSDALEQVMAGLCQLETWAAGRLCLGDNLWQCLQCAWTQGLVAERGMVVAGAHRGSLG